MNKRGGLEGQKGVRGVKDAISFPRAMSALHHKTSREVDRYRFARGHKQQICKKGAQECGLEGPGRVAKVLKRRLFCVCVLRLVANLKASAGGKL